MTTKNELRDLLAYEVVKITFEKTDGTIRVLNGTLRPDFLPEMVAETVVLTKTKREENPNILAVWDVDLADWRSFRVNSVKSILVIDLPMKKGV